MSFGLSRGRALDVGEVGIEASDLPPLPDDVAVCPEGARLDPRRWFEHPERPFEIEIGSGKGTFLLQQAALDEGVNFLGIEWAGEFYAYAADRVRRSGLGNVRLLHADATEFIHWRMPDGVAQVIHLYFSDPWPKARHHKRRVVQEGFLADAHRVMTAHGEIRIVTDHDDYWRWIEQRVALVAPADGAGLFERREFSQPASAGAGEIVGTNFERKYAREGRPFHAMVLRRIGG